ncbi:hypothetical protein C8J56DRAFT_1042244 [Mycena floridula]|nr:hypothetical protein C8J56DRAFT_1042244 [Mycena floridula]
MLDIVAASLSESGYKLVDQRQFQCRRLFAMDALPISSMPLSSSSEALDVASPCNPAPPIASHIPLIRNQPFTPSPSAIRHLRAAGKVVSDP